MTNPGLLMPGKILLATTLLSTGLLYAGNGQPASPSPPDVKTIVSQMEERNRRRETLLHGYTVERTYKVENKRINKAAKATATMIFLMPGEKLFEVHSYAGFGFMLRGVIDRILETERLNATPEQRPKSSIASSNYEFEWVAAEEMNGRLQYVLHARPRRKGQLLFDAKVWIDAEDFAVTRIEGRPAKNPSFWTRKVEFLHEYGKLGPFWLPIRNHSVSQILFFGQSTTDLEYFNYRINPPDLAERAAEMRKNGQKLEIQVDAKDKK
jgi:hypothetical protein